MERHKIFIYKEDINRFLDNLQDTVDYLKDELMPDYDFDEFNRKKQEERARYEQENYYDEEEWFPMAQPMDGVFDNLVPVFFLPAFF